MSHMSRPTRAREALARQLRGAREGARRGRRVAFDVYLTWAGAVRLDAEHESNVSMLSCDGSRRLVSLTSIDACLTRRTCD